MHTRTASVQGDRRIFVAPISLGNGHGLLTGTAFVGRALPVNRLISVSPRNSASSAKS